jgi:ATP-binding protein involved in chromosome partitioning
MNIFIREAGDVGRLESALKEGSPTRPHLMSVVENLAAQVSIRNMKNVKMPKLEIIS